MNEEIKIEGIMMNEIVNTSRTTVISGSFRRNYSNIIKLLKMITCTKKITVLSPAESRVINSNADFVLLESDSKEASIKEIEDKHLDAIKQADFLVVSVPDGKLGYSTLIEMGFAIAFDKPIYCIGEVHDTMISQYVTTLSEGRDLINIIENDFSGIREK
ncbi:MAG: nucleoside 2-deoxyribosyltransferase, partial [Deltaproteobacteria bacterium]|nr:nucleoside 2-deoxyribosyltransferase [Deltaproteobacteria bacterium]